MPPAVAGLLAAGAIVLSGVLTIEQAYRGDLVDDGHPRRRDDPAVDGDDASGAAGQLADMLVDVVGDAGPHALLLGLFVLTARARPADQQHGDGADRDPDRALGGRRDGRVAEPVLMASTVVGGGGVPDPGRDAGEPDGDGAGRLPLRRLLEARPAAARAVRHRRGAARAGVLGRSEMRTATALRLHRAAARRPSGCAALVAEAHERFRGERRGRDSDVYPALARVPPDLFGVCVAGIDGDVYAAGDAELEFTIMSVSKPFVFALVCEAARAERRAQRVGVDATGCRSTRWRDRAERGRADEPDGQRRARSRRRASSRARPRRRWRFIHDGLSRFAGRDLALDEEVYASASRDNERNRASPACSRATARIGCDPAEAVDLYTRQCSLRHRARPRGHGRDARRRRREPGHGRAGGRRRPLPLHARGDDDRRACTRPRATGSTTSACPARAASAAASSRSRPARAALGTFAPRLDDAGNSVKGQLVARFLSAALGLDLFASAARTPAP